MTSPGAIPLGACYLDTGQRPAPPGASGPLAPSLPCGRSLSDHARRSLLLPPPGRSCIAGLPWHTPHPCLRRLNPARTAAARVALRVVIMPCADVCRCRSVRRCTLCSRTCRGVRGHSWGLSNLCGDARMTVCGAWPGSGAARSERSRRASADSETVSSVSGVRSAADVSSNEAGPQSGRMYTYMLYHFTDLSPSQRRK